MPSWQGKAIVVADKETYIQKMYQQIDEVDILRDIETDEFCCSASLDIKSFYPKVPVKKAHEYTWEALEADTTIKDRTEWARWYNKIAGNMHRNTF